MADIISWVATVATIVAAFMTAANLGSRVTGYGFAVFTFGALCWIAAGVLTRPAGADVDQRRSVRPRPVRRVALARAVRRGGGGRARRRRSERADAGRSAVPGFVAGPRPVRCGDREVGHCIDAMAGCRSGRSIISSCPKAGSPGSANGCAACRGAMRMSTTNTVVARTSPPSASTASKSCEGTEWPGR